MRTCFRLLFLLMTLVVLAACAAPLATVPPTGTAVPVASPSLSSPTSPSPPSTSTPSRPPIQTPDWFRNVVLYEIFPRSFYDSNGDGIGDLRGITARLDYIQQLGAGAIWLTPIFASPSYHGYDTVDYYKINPDFGNEADLVELVREAHRRNIRVLLDYVVAHTSNRHPFFQDALGNVNSQYAGWYHWTNPEHTQYESFAGTVDMPTLNHANPEVQQYLIDVARYWMKTGIDGYRADYVLNVPHPFWKKLRSEIKASNPDFLLLAEAWTNAREIQPYYDGEFDATFDFPLYGDIEGSQNATGDSLLLGRRSPQLMDGTLTAEQVLYPPGAERVVFLNNHDTDRVMAEVLGNVRRAKLGATLLLTQPGTPMIYYGEEIGTSGIKGTDDKPLREPMDWYTAESGPGMTTWFKPPARNNKPGDGVSVQEEQGQADSLLEHYRTLVQLRKANPALQTGDWTKVAVDGSDRVYGYLRSQGQTLFLVLLNFAESPATAAIDLTASSMPDIKYTATDALSTKVVRLTGLKFDFTLDALTGYILRLAPE